MKIKYNGQPIQANKVADKLGIKLNDMTLKQFRKVVLGFYNQITNIRQKTRQVMKAYFRQNIHQKVSTSSGILPNMFRSDTGKPASERMLANLIYDMFKATLKLDSKIPKATITVPYGIDWDGKKNTVTVKGKNKTWWYARILNQNKRFSRFNGYLRGVSDVYRSEFISTAEETFKKKFSKSISSTYRY